ncbi:vitelline envelope sperm lysin receptor-like [Haliotis rubra]|uniref:vitelline envelope sperm lysin receptor-like n=1 Tax=Haliotis rubra TaxID=36100 RepID=UPI001EE5ADE6|nr:vitelline envelope sperm lysin receptor-like [Haliotis rubra]
MSGMRWSFGFSCLFFLKMVWICQAFDAGAPDSRVRALNLNISCSADKSEPAVLISYPITFRAYYIKDMQLICKNGWIPIVQESGFKIILIQYPQASSSLIPGTCVFHGPYFITKNGSVEVYNMTVAVLWNDGTPSYLSFECNFTKSASESNHSHPPASRTNLSTIPSTRPQSQSTSQPTFRTNTEPASQPASQPTPQPVSQPTPQLTAQPTSHPTPQLTAQPTSQPTPQLTAQPTPQLTSQPTSQPTPQLTSQPSTEPNPQAIFQPTSGTTNRISSPRPSSSAPPGQSSIQSIPLYSTPNPETTAPHQSGSVTTQHGLIRWKIYCGNNASIPATYIDHPVSSKGRVVRNIQILCENGWMSVTQKIGFNVIIIQYPHDKMDRFPGMCVFFGPYVVPMNASVQLYNVTMAQFWGDGLPTYVNIECFLPRSDNQTLGAQADAEHDSMPTNEQSGQTYSSSMRQKYKPTQATSTHTSSSSRPPASEELVFGNQSSTPDETAPNYQTQSSEPDATTPTSSTSAPGDSPRSRTPPPEDSPTSSTPAPEASPTSRTPASDTNPSSSTSVQTPSISHSTTPGQMSSISQSPKPTLSATSRLANWDVYCSQNVNIPAKLISLVTLNVSKTEINCSNGIVPITQQFGFNMMLIHYTNGVSSDSPGMCVFWGPYPVPNNDSVLLYNATAWLEWGEGLPIFLPIKCFLPKSALAFNPDTSPKSSTLAPESSPSSSTPAPEASPSSSTPAPEASPSSSTPAPEASPSSSTPAPEASPSSSTPAPEASPSSSTPAPEASPSSSTPAPEASPSSSTPAPEASPSSSTPAPEASPSSSTPAPEASPSSSTPAPEASPSSSTPAPEASPSSSTPAPEASPSSSTRLHQRLVLHQVRLHQRLVLHPCTRG